MKRKGFTLVELLIGLAVLGVIATFTIPKMLNLPAQQKALSVSKEAAAFVGEGLLHYKTSNAITASTGMTEIMSFLNTLPRQTTGDIDHKPGLGTLDCSYPGNHCYPLYSGAALFFTTDSNYSRFGGVSSDHALLFSIDPDGKVSDAKAVEFVLYTNGFLRTTGTMKSGTYNGGGGPWVPIASSDPDWFKWN